MKDICDKVDICDEEGEITTDNKFGTDNAVRNPPQGRDVLKVFTGHKMMNQDYVIQM